MHSRTLLIAVALLAGCGTIKEARQFVSQQPYVIVLGVSQDAGFPQAGCQKKCCAEAWKKTDLRRMVSCIAVVDPVSDERWLIDATPDFKDQLAALGTNKPSGMFLTHAHIGHYTGLMHLGREVMGAKEIPVYAMPRMFEFLSTNGPWDQLVKLKNISIKPLAEGQTIQLNARLSITPFTVPHRDEYSETVGYKIAGPGKTVVYIPDIDKWEKWTTRIEDVIAEADVCYLDGTFYADGELPGRNMSEIPHPFVMESMSRFAALFDSERDKIKFIHFNHTNPLLRHNSCEQIEVLKEGFGIAREFEIIRL